MIDHRQVRRTWAALAAWAAWTAWTASTCPTAHAGADPHATPDLAVGAAQYPDDDAVILRWVQEWSVQTDGALTRREHQWVKLLNTRPIGRFADQRIPYREGEDEVVVHAARTHLPNGDVLPVPDYAYNVGAARDVEGWPALAAWKERIISFSGIEPGVTLELDYEVATKAGVLPWVSADVRLDDEYPVVERIVRVTLGPGAAAAFRFERTDEVARSDLAAPARTTGQTRTYEFVFGPMTGSPDEAHSPRWEKRCPRMGFTTAGGAEAWVAALQQAVRRAAQPTDAIRAFTKDTVKDSPDREGQLRALADKLSARFNYVQPARAFRSLECRDAGEVFAANYGNRLEAAALLLAAVQALDIPADVAVAVDADAWTEDVPTDAAFVSVVVVADKGESPVYVDPQRGIVRNPGRFGGHLLLDLDHHRQLTSVRLTNRGEGSESGLRAIGRLVVADDGAATGELRLHLTGRFYDPQDLTESARQEAFLKRLVGRLLSHVKVTGHSIQTLSDESLVAVIQVASEGPLPGRGDGFGLRLSDGPACLESFPMPLARSLRRLPVQLAGPFREDFELAVEYPEGWSAPIVPATLAKVSGAWGAIEQQTTTEANTVRLARRIALQGDVLDPEDFAVVRTGLNELRADGSLWMLIGP